MSGPYIIDDDRLARALREVSRLKVEFDIAEEIRKETAKWNAGARLSERHCPDCGKRGVVRCDCEGR